MKPIEETINIKDPKDFKIKDDCDPRLDDDMIPNIKEDTPKLKVIPSQTYPIFLESEESPQAIIT